MADSYTANLKLATPSPDPGAQNWNVELDRNRAIIDAQNAIGDLAVSSHEQPSASLLVDVSTGLFANQAGTVVTYAGATSVAITASTTTSVYLTNAGVLTLSVAGFPAAPALYIPLAVVVAGVGAITSITDARVAFNVCANPCLPLSGGSLTDGANVVLGTGTGTKWGTATNQKQGFFGKTPIVQPAIGAGTAGTSYTTNEQAMLQAVFNAVRALGLGS